MTIILTNDDIPATMRRIRMEKRITQTALAKRMYITNAALSYWEAGYNGHGPSVPHIDKLAGWANALGYDLTVTLTPKGEQ